MIKLALLGHGPFAQPTFDRLKETYEITDIYEAQCLIVANYGHILSPEQLEKPEFGAINLHGSLLPKYRGATPIQTAIANGDHSTGVTIIKIDNQVDHGPILASEKLDIDSDDTTESIKTKLGIAASKLVFDLLPQYFSGHLELIEQNHQEATYTKKISPTDTTLDMNEDNQKIYNFYRAYSQKPGFFINLSDNVTIKIIKAKFENSHFIPQIVQRLGKQEMSYKDFLNGYRLKLPFTVDTE
jgi:methionyl-tRNA formyltransferase